MNKIIICVLLLCGFACINNTNKKMRESNIEKATTNKGHFLTGKTINSIDSVLSKKIEHNYVIYIFNSLECGTCVNSGFYLLNQISTLYEQVYVITPSFDNPAMFQEKYHYYEYIYQDNKDLIRKELKYIPTPVFLLLNNKNKIIDVYFPKNTISDENKIFMQSCSCKLIKK